MSDFGGKIRLYVGHGPGHSYLQKHRKARKSISRSRSKSRSRKSRSRSRSRKSRSRSRSRKSRSRSRSRKSRSRSRSRKSRSRSRSRKSRSRSRVRIGPLKEGGLAGWHADDTKTARRAALRKAARRDGRTKVLKRLLALKLLNKNRNPRLSGIAKRDEDWAYDNL